MNCFIQLELSQKFLYVNSHGLGIFVVPDVNNTNWVLSKLISIFLYAHFLLLQVISLSSNVIGT